MKPLRQESLAATSALRGEFVQGGGDANKFDAAMNKVSITQEAMTIAAKNLEKATREFGKTQLETGLAVAGFVGTAIQAVSSLRGFKEGAATLSPLLAKVGKAIAGTTGPQSYWLQELEHWQPVSLVL